MTIDLDAYLNAFPSLHFCVVNDGVLEVVLGTTERHNALDAEGHRDLSRVWLTIDADADVRSVLVRGAGNHFSAGGDFSLIQRILADDETLVRVWKEASDLVYNLVNCSKPVVSVIRGSAVGAGLAVALLADVSVAASDAVILDGHTRLGVAAGDHAVMIWPLLCGLAKARYHLLTNTRLSGEQAERIGLVSVCVADEEAYPRGLDIANNLAAASPTAVQWTKRALNNWLRLAGPSFDASLALEFLGFRLGQTASRVDDVRNRKS
jgi:enoyl-CoA hydratase